MEEANKVLGLSNRIGPLTEEEQNFIYSLILETGAQNQDELVNNAKLFKIDNGKVIETREGMRDINEQ